MTKVVINRCYGGFGLSDIAFERYLDLKGIKYRIGTAKGFDGRRTYETPEGDYLSYLTIDRDDPILVKVVEELKDRANGLYSELKVVEVPDDVEWDIEDYDGIEWVAEKHRTWS